MKPCLSLLAILIPCVALGASDPYGNTEHEGVPEVEGHALVSYARADWQEPLRLSVNDGNESISPRLVADGSGRIHTVWKDNWHSHNEILYRSGGETAWDEIETISDPDTSHNSPWIAADSDRNLHTVFLRWTGIPWGDYDIGYRKYDYDLGMWEAEERLTYQDAIGSSGRPKVLCDAGDVVYVFWLYDDAPRAIWHMCNDGSGWTAKETVTAPTDSPNGYFGTAVSPDNTIHCVWQDYRSGTAELYHRYLRDGSWSASTAVTNNGIASVYPRLAADALSNIYLVYGGGASLDEKIHVLVWDAATETWGPETVFPSQMAMPHVDIAVDQSNGDVHLTFHEWVISNTEIMYKHYDASSGAWEETVQLTSGNPHTRLDPQICLDPSGYAHIVWWDERDGTGQEEIYYTTNRAGAGIGESFAGVGDQLRLIVGPNPFTGATEILVATGESYGLTEIPITAGQHSGLADRGVTDDLGIYDIDGRLVTSLGFPQGAPYRPATVLWNGRDRYGRECPAGVYVLRLEHGTMSVSSRVIKVE